MPKEKGEQTLQEFLSYLEDGSVEINTAFYSEDDDTFTHQFLVINSGDAVVKSSPERLTIPLQPVPGTSLEGVTIN